MLKFERLVELVYDAPLTHNGWSVFLDALGTATSTRAVGLKWVSIENQQFRMIDNGLEPDVVRAYGERYSALDSWSAVPLAHDADVFGDEMLPRAQLERSEFYQDFCRHHGLEDIHKIMLARTAEQKISIGLMKEARVRDGDAERRLTRRLAPHLRRAIALTDRLATVEDGRDALRDALDLSNAAVFFLGEHGKILFATTAAEKLLARGDGLLVKKGLLHAERPDDDRALGAYLAGQPEDAVSTLVRRSSGLVPYSVFLVARATALPAGVSQLAVVTEALVPRTAETVLRHGYALTSAELRVALRVGRGASPKRVAEELDVSWYTVRAQLRTVFAKTGVRRQAELVDLLARLEHG